jgi:asparagine synthase (glutamine-hydrolysing)
VSAALAFYDSEKGGLRSWTGAPSMATWRLSEEAYHGGNPSMSALTRIFPASESNPLPCFDPGEDTLKAMIQWECHQRLGELLLMRLDKMTMAQSIEGRAPFLDTSLVELAMQIPSSFKIMEGVGKAVLKRAVEPLVPRELIYRPKIGFCGGSGNMLTPAILDFAARKTMETLPPLGWNRPVLDRMISDHRAGRAENSFQIWNLMNLALWFRKWF